MYARSVTATTEALEMSATDEALSDLRGVGPLLTGKRKREEELAHQPVGHSLWEQDSLEAHNDLLFDCLDGEVEALQQREAAYDEERKLSDGSGIYTFRFVYIHSGTYTYTHSGIYIYTQVPSTLLSICLVSRSGPLLRIYSVSHSAL